jgi:REP element-mobilizing transposase RayT
MFRMLSHKAEEIKCPPARSGGWIDHVHILCGLSRTVTVAQLVEHLKTETSKWVKERTRDLANFHWQAGYGVFSVSQSVLEQVIEYIARQEEHHRKLTYQEEFRLMCKKHGIEIDERYVWD